MQNFVVVMLRNIVLFFLTLFIVRIIGRSSLSKATPFKFVSYMVIAIIPSLISLGLLPNITFGIIALAVWFLLPIAVDYLAMKSKWVHDLINGRETIVIKDGKVIEESLKDLRYTGEEWKKLRTRNVFNLADVEFAVMETTGDINVSLKADKKPITSYDLGKKVAPKTEPQTVILDGNILNEGLTNIGLNQGWLKTELENKGVALENVFIGQVDSSGDLYVDLLMM